MKKEEFDSLVEICNPVFKPIISNIINSNYKYFMLTEGIKWAYTYDDNIDIMAVCDRKTNIVSVNLNSLVYSFENNRMMDIEYFVVHEIRHLFQHIEIRKYQNKEKTIVDPSIIQFWINEFNHYVKALDEDGNENDDYFKQDCEIDAYAFSYALMKYKYGEENIKNLYIPIKCGDGFFTFVNQFIEGFEDIDNPISYNN